MNILKLKSKRVLLGYTQKEVANQLQIETSSYNKKENGKNDFSVREISTLKALFKLSDEEFIGIFFDENSDFKSQNPMVDKDKSA